MEALSREFKAALPWELLYTDDLVVIAEIEGFRGEERYESKYE